MLTEEWSLDIGGEEAIAVVRVPTIPTARPALLIHLTLYAERSLDEEPYATLPRVFLEAGHTVASFDLPHHGRLRDQFGEGLPGMAAAFAAGRNVFAPALATGSALIDSWLDWTPNPGPIVVAGVSRGGLIALHLCVAEPRIAACAAFAPVTDLAVLHEFAGLTDSALVRDASALGLAPRLRDRPLFLTINEKDDRVSTAACCAFFNAVRADGRDDDLHRLRVDPGCDHTVSDAAYCEGTAWLLRHAEATLDRLPIGATVIDV